MKKLAIFDLDGTLLNTIDDLAAAGNHALTAHGFPIHKADDYRYFVGDGVVKLVERMMPAHVQDPALLASVQQAFHAYYNAHSTDLTAPYEGVIALLDALESRGVSTAVLSNKPHVFTCALCQRFFENRFAVVHGQREGYPCKPAGSLVDELLNLSGVQAQQCLYIGDSGVDMQTAKNAQVLAVGVLWGFRPKEELLRCGADVTVSHPMEILRQIDANAY